jgi:GNAT superfamily N-acetyltransferase
MTTLKNKMVLQELTTETLHFSEFLTMAHDYHEGRYSNKSIHDTYLQLFGSNKISSRFLFIDGNLAGFVIYDIQRFSFQGNWMYLCDLYVKPNFRRFGGARMMLEFVISESKRMNLPLYWDTSRDNPACSLYNQYADINKTDVMYDKLKTL